LHSLSGVVPIGVFLVNHLLTNSLTPWPQSFDEEVEWIHGLPYLVFVEFGMIILPLVFHAGYGVVIAMQAEHNVSRYGYGDNWRYTLQRVTGWIAAAFIVIHLLHFRFSGLVGASDYPDLVHDGMTPYNAAAQGFSALLPVAAWMAIYAIGLVASVYHFANGLCTFCITWGITVGLQSRRYVSIGAAGLGAVLLTWGFMSLVGIGRGEIQHDGDGYQQEAVHTTAVESHRPGQSEG
jgi:succinate dehydrogenase / fumarate reductase cytochrome b subunit